MPPLVLQRVVFPEDRRLSRLYFRSVGGDGRPTRLAALDRLSATLPAGVTLTTGRYFNTFFEYYWRRYTRLGALRLRLRLTGAGAVVLVRRTRAGPPDEVARADFDGAGATVVLDVPTPGPRAADCGALHFRLAARSPEVVLHRAEWLAADVGTPPAALGVGYCTFDREAPLLRNLRALLGDADVAAVVRRIFVVDQGTRRLRDFPGVAALAGAGRKLHVVEQANHGGAGGFTRAILEARSTAGITHLLLSDDDAVIEPEGVLRAAAFLALARQELAVGGQMLDAARPCEVFESGAQVQPNALQVRSSLHGGRVSTARALRSLCRVRATTHYNAWYFFAFPLRLVDRVGLPLPLFLRGDDAEFGCRLFRARVPTVPLPGVAVWHERCDQKPGGWQRYYELRNLLILTALHFPPAPRRAAAAVLRQLLSRLLALEYEQAEDLLAAVDDFLRGPALFEADPRPIHAALVARRARGDARPEVPAGPTARRATRPHSRLGQALRLLRCLVHQALCPTPTAAAVPDRRIAAGEDVWWALGTADVAVADGAAGSPAWKRRSRARFWRLLGRGVWSAGRLWRAHRRAAHAWRAAFGWLTSDAFWRAYLGLNDAPLPADELDAGPPARAA